MGAGIRVLRLLEYRYGSVEAYESDRAHWQIQGTYRPSASLTITSVALPIEVLADVPEVHHPEVHQ